MRLSVKTLQLLKDASEVVPGNVYPAKGGRGNTAYWLVVATSQTGAHNIGFDEEGLPVSTASYLKSAMRERPVIGRVDISSLSLESLPWGAP